MSVRLQSCAYIMVTFCTNRRLSYLVSTNDMAMQGTRVSATMEMSHFSWNIPIPATEGFLKIFSTSIVYRSTI